MITGKIDTERHQNKTYVSCLDDYRPVALTSVAMKMLESFVLTY